MTNPTMEKFGYPSTLIREYDHWCVVLRPAQATLGALVLVCKQNVQAFSQISGPAFDELARVTAGIETGLAAFRRFDKINYLMLMMVDKEVHFHVIPRYGTLQSFDGVDFNDPGWPGMPDLSNATQLDEAGMSALLNEIKSHWPG